MVMFRFLVLEIILQPTEPLDQDSGFGIKHKNNQSLVLAFRECFVIFS